MIDNMSAKGGSLPAGGHGAFGGKNYLNLLSHELFYALSGAILLFAGLEFLAPGIILAYFNLNYLLLIWLVNGIIIAW